MAQQVELPEERLKTFLCHLQAESGILDRIIYKNKNQHRRSSYFQYLLKVKRDLKLFHSVHVEELLDSCFNVITGRKAKQKAHLLESLKRRKCDSGNYNFLDRLQGVARLLSEMVEPMLKAATEISILLARSFFMGFSLMVLALLARLRVLVQQMLLDVVCVFNEVSSLAQKKQSIKITQDGIEVFREYYPTVEDEIVALECVWKTDKFVLKEISGKGKILHQDRRSETVQTQETSVKYRSIDTFLGDEYDSQNSENEGENSISNAKTKRRPESPSPSSDENNKKVEKFSAAADSLGNSVLQQIKKTPLGGCSLASSISPPISSSFTNNLMAKKKVAFISVKQTIPVSSEAAVSVANEGEGKRHEEENALFRHFAEEEARGSIF